MLKKFSYIILAVFVAVLVSVYNSKPLFFGLNENYVVYKVDGSSCAVQTVIDTLYYPFMARVKGESCKIERLGFDVKSFFDRYNAEIVFTENLEGVTCYYGFSDDINFCSMLNGKLVNLHVAVAKDYVTVGSPIIFGSF